ncbi:MAG: SagB/ThcOx family dehydrogenase [Anaerolineales bacterium]
MADVKANRRFLKADVWEEMETTDQRRGKPHPPLQRPYPEAAPLISLVPMDELSLDLSTTVADAIAHRQSVRRYADEELTLEELSFLLWSTQGVRYVHPSGRALFRTVPSAGARHPFETYLVIRRVADLAVGLYRYLSLGHQLSLIRTAPDLPEKAAAACHRQSFVADAAVTFFWTAVPYRTEWRYGEAAAKLVALDAGHVCENLYLAAAAVGCGACAIAAYNQSLVDDLLGVDGEEEFAIYVAPVGKQE